jgi:transposase
MKRYVGLDVHARHFSMAVMDPDGEFLFEKTYPMSLRKMRRAIEVITGEKIVVLEESTLAGCVFRHLQPHVEQIVVAEPYRNRLIGRDENIHDIAAARKLAQLLHGGFIHPVHHPQELERQVFKELVQAYQDTTREVTRVKNRLKAKFRQHGIVCEGDDVYDARERDAWLAQQPAAGVRFAVQQLFATLAHFEQQKRQGERELRRAGRAFEPIARFEKVPGIGPIRAATFFAFVDTPARFATKSKLWAYCGIGIAQRRSDQMAGPPHLNRRGNRTLKDVAKGAAGTAIGQGDNVFAHQYARRIAKGTSPEMARLTVARAIVSAMWAMWRKGEPFAPQERTGASTPRPKKRRRAHRRSPPRTTRCRTDPSTEPVNLDRS